MGTLWRIEGCIIATVYLLYEYSMGILTTACMRILYLRCTTAMWENSKPTSTTVPGMGIYNLRVQQQCIEMLSLRAHHR